jgi:hypothetical protein
MKLFIAEDEIKSIRRMYGLNEQRLDDSKLKFIQQNPLEVSGSYTATNCDELHAFQSTGGKKIGNMNVIVGDKIKEFNSNGIFVEPIAVGVNVDGMTVNWKVEFTLSDINWVGFTSRGAGCNLNIDERAGNDSINNGPKSIVDKLKGEGKTVGKIEIVGEVKHNGGKNSFKQVFYRYTLVDTPKSVEPSKTETPKPVEAPKTETPKSVEPVKTATPKPAEPVKAVTSKPVEAPKPAEPVKAVTSKPVEAPKPAEPVKAVTSKPVESPKTATPKPDGVPKTATPAKRANILTINPNDF